MNSVHGVDPRRASAISAPAAPTGGLETGSVIVAAKFA
jgi:hypothetical protein